jgi:hypothetical protein
VERQPGQVFAHVRGDASGRIDADMAKDKQSLKNSQAVKAGISALKKAGLYKPDKPRGPVTRYALGLLKKFEDVIKGTAQAVKVPAKVAARFAEDDASLRANRRRVAVPVQKGERAFYSKKTGNIRAVFASGRDRYIREPFSQRPTTLAGIRRQLGPNDKIMVPINHGRKKPLGWQSFTLEEFQHFWEDGASEQTDIDGNVTDFRTRLASHIQIFKFEGPHAKKPESFMSPGEARAAHKAAKQERIAEIYNRVVSRRRKNEH